MRWRYAKAGILGALLAISAQLTIDIYIDVTLHNCFDACIAPDLNRMYPEENLAQARFLYCLRWLLVWLSRKGELAGRTAMLTALLAASSVMAADQIQVRRKARKQATVA